MCVVVYDAELSQSIIEKAFIEVAIDLHEIVVMDGIDPLPDLSGFRIRSHDLSGPLPEIIIQRTGDFCPILNRIQNDAAKLVSAVRVRSHLARIFPGCEFLLPTRMDKGVLVGLRFRGRTMLAEDRSYWEAYHQLWGKAAKFISQDVQE